MQAWSTFYATVAGAAATLLGLLFVAVSVRASAALGSQDPLTRDMTEQAFQNFVAVLLAALLSLYPDIDPRSFAFVCLASVGARALWLAPRVARTFRGTAPRGSLVFALRRHLAAAVGFGLLLYAIARMALGHDDQHNTLAAALLVLLVSAMTVSWELLRRLANTP